MEQKQVLALAKQGNPQAIAALMNRHLQASGQGVRAKLAERGNMLQIVLESSQVPNQQDAVSFVVKGLTNLGFSGVAKIYGRRTGEELPAWVQETDFSESRLETDQPQTEETIHCPQCQSIQVLANKRGFGLGEAAIGAILLGPIGLAGGLLGSNQVSLNCLKCGYQWKIGQLNSVMAAKAKPTKAKVKRMALRERLGCGIGGAILTVLIGALFFGYAAWFVAIIVALGFLFGVDEWTAKLQGNCPYCDKEITTSLEQKKFNCDHCQGQISSTKLNSEQYQFNPAPNV